MVINKDDAGRETVAREMGKQKMRKLRILSFNKAVVRYKLF